ncbi:MAG: 4Fe-4S dicluster domain-containing protein [Acidimicrobiia bacterium]|nr:4Fe-4S dicluster domain-containing protein [Acidimicrobiia bacterium]
MVAHIIDIDGLDGLIASLKAEFDVIGPIVRDGLIRYGPIGSVADLPRGWTDVQEGGSYRLEPGNTEALFGFVLGPDSGKTNLFPPRAPMWTYREESFSATPHSNRPMAIIGLRACDLAAIAIQDEVLLNGPYVDSHYAARRSQLFIVAVNCTTFAANCFCTSMNTGPRVESGFDLGLTEVLDDHHFVVHVGSEAGASFLAGLDQRQATSDELAEADQLIDITANSITKRLDTTDIAQFLADNLESPRWSAIAERCLACTNCTAACPTCFCTSPVDTTDFDGSAARERVWDSCFSLDYSYMGGHPVRSSGSSRYRQWMTHKLGTWIEQFGTSGCVGCGRCITWCPVGIDITEEMAAMRAEVLAKEAR